MVLATDSRPPTSDVMLPAMTGATTTYLSKASPVAPVSRTSRRDLPPVLLRLAVRRLQVVAAVVLVAMLTSWLLGNLIEGQLRAEFARVGEWGPPAFMITASFAMLGLARWRRVQPPTVVAWALVYQVAVSFAIAFSEYFNTFATFPPQLMEQDVVGYTLVFEKDSYAALLLAHAALAPEPPSARAAHPIPPGVDAVVLACLAKDPADRVESAQALDARLAGIPLPEPWTTARAAEWWQRHPPAREHRPAT